MSQISKVWMLLVIVGLLAGGLTSCKSKKKLAREKAATEYAQKVKQAKQDLTAIVNGDTNWSIEEQAKRVQTIKGYNIDDADVMDLTTKAEDKINALKAEAKRKAEEEHLRKNEEAKKRAEQSQYAVYNRAFEKIADAGDINSANALIDEALQRFATPDVPVLIIISQTNGINDYDRPTTASRFLNYLKDQGNYGYRVATLKKNSLGKITEMELLKK